MHFNRNFSFQEVLKCHMIYYGEILVHLKGRTPLKLVLLFSFSVVSSVVYLDLYHSARICRASLIKHLFISSFSPRSIVQLGEN